MSVKCYFFCPAYADLGYVNVHVQLVQKSDFIKTIANYLEENQ